MKIMKHLTWLHLKHNKKRTIVTMLGIIISVAMITAVGTGFSSGMNFIVEYVMESTGRWHVKYEGKIADEPKYSKSANMQMYEKEMGYAAFPESINEYKPYIFLMAYEKATFKNMALKLEKGRFAKSDSELVISRHMLDDGGAKYEVGDKITLNMGQRFITSEGEKDFGLNQDTPLFNTEDEKEGFCLTGEKKTYTIVGIVSRPELEPFSAPGYSAFTFLDRAKIGEQDTIIDYIFLKKVCRKTIKQFQKNSAFILNNRVIKYCGISTNEEIDDQLMYVVAVLGMVMMFIIITGTVCLIYNAFAISASDRSKEFGMLSSVGATGKQKRRAVLLEAALMSVICIPVGIFSGLLGIGVTFYELGKYFRWAVGTDITMSVYITFNMLILIVLLSLLTIFISAWIPAKRAESMSAIEAVTKRKEYHYTERAMRTPRAVRKLFGFEGELALKNLKRNRRQYRGVTLSIMISFVLFTTLSTYLHLVTQAYEDTYNYQDYDIQITPNENDASNRVIFEELKKVKGVQKGFMLYKGSVPVSLSKEIFTNLISDGIKDLLKDGGFAANYGASDENFSMGASLIGLEDEEMKLYAKHIGMSEAEYKSMTTTDIILVNQKKHILEGRFTNFQLFDVEKGEKILFHIGKKKWNANISKVTTEYPMGTRESERDVLIPVIVMPIEQLKELVKEYKEELEGSADFSDVVSNKWYYTIKRRNPIEIQEGMEKILNKEYETKENYNLYNARKGNGQEQAIGVICNVLADGFIVLISLICVANLCNTITTSFELRRREFAMLKSVGMEQKKFRRMICYESMFYGIKALILGMPVSIGLIYLMYRGINIISMSQFKVPIIIYTIGVLGIVVIISSGMFYASRKVTKENIMDGLRMQ